LPKKREKMYAIIKDGGRQLKVEVDNKLRIDYRDQLKPGDAVEFAEVLAISKENDVTLGKPTVAGAKVVAEVVSDFKGQKLIVARFRRRKNSKRKTGHRQIYTLVKIKEIVG
jgi:large subunit ribosomal protein L21